MNKPAEGFTILKRYGQLKTACWILENNGEAAIVEMPPFSKKEKPPYEKANAYFKKNKLFPKYGFLSHSHWDHSFTLPKFREVFPQTRFVTHESFMHDPFFSYYIVRNMRNARGRNWVMGGYRFFDDVFSGNLYTGDIGGEPVYLIHAPKHSYSDLLIVFRGAMITGDWYLGDLKDCNDLVDPRDKIASINRTIEIMRNLNYNIHMLFSAHGDSLFYDADFFSIMEQSKVNHNGNQPNMKARFVPG